jgi:hypothetical protein
VTDLGDLPHLVTELKGLALAEINVLSLAAIRHHCEGDGRTTLVIDIRATAAYAARVHVGKYSLPKLFLLACLCHGLPSH